MDKMKILVLTALLCCSVIRGAIHDESSMDNNYLCSNIEVREVASNLDYDLQATYPKLKRAAMWFGPRMGKRGPDVYDEVTAGSQPDDLMNNIQVLLKRELDGKLGPDSPWIVYLVTGKWIILLIISKLYFFPCRISQQIHDAPNGPRNRGEVLGTA